MRCGSPPGARRSNPIGTDNLVHEIGVAARKRKFEPLAERAREALREEGGPEAVDRLALRNYANH